MPSVEPGQGLMNDANSSSSFFFKSPRYAYKSTIHTIFSPPIPSPIKLLFQKVPLITYETNALPARSSTASPRHRLYVFSAPEDAATGRPSFNPSCLKWQTYLRLAQIPFDLVPSNNHASPNGILPFLIPACSDSEGEWKGRNIPIPSNKFRKFAEENGRAPKETESPRYAPYESLLNGPIRKAWLHTLYLSPGNAHIPLRLYINPTSSSALIRTSLSNTLTKAARSELASASSGTGSSLSIFGSAVPEVDVNAIYQEACEAFEALDIVLGQDEWFLGGREPGEFDASVFAYCHLLLDQGGMGWKDRRLVEMVKGCGNLVGHRERLWERCYERVYEVI